MLLASRRCPRRTSAPPGVCLSHRYRRGCARRVHTSFGEVRRGKPLQHRNAATPSAFDAVHKTLAPYFPNPDNVTRRTHEVSISFRRPTFSDNDLALLRRQMASQADLPAVPGFEPAPRDAFHFGRYLCAALGREFSTSLASNGNTARTDHLAQPYPETPACRIGSSNRTQQVFGTQARLAHQGVEEHLAAAFRAHVHGLGLGRNGPQHFR